MRKSVTLLLATSLLGSAAVAQNYPQQPYPNQPYPQQGPQGYPSQYPNQPVPQPYPGYPQQTYPQQGYPNAQYQDQNYAINMCNQAVTLEAQKYGRPQLGQITSVEPVRGGFKIKGIVSVTQMMQRDWHRDGDHRDGDRHDGDRGYNQGQFPNGAYNGAYAPNTHWNGRPIIHQGNYTCEVKYGKINKLKVRDLGDQIRR